MSGTDNNSTSRGTILLAKSGAKTAILDLLKKAMDKEVFDAILIPMMVPARNAFTYVLVKDKLLLKDAFPLPPIMSVQGAQAVSSITRRGKGNIRIAAVMRPCEIRATIELAKLGQTHLENITLISMDCPGVLPLSDFLDNPKKGTEAFSDAVKKGEDNAMRPICQICDKSSWTVGDLHVGTLGTKVNSIFIIPNSQKGEDVLDKLGIPSKENIETWRAEREGITEKKHKNRKKMLKNLKSTIGGLDNFLDAFSHCINCHNCMRVCPICYCRLCYFDSEKVKYSSTDYLQRAKDKGSIRFPPDTTLFHVGRMLHMSLSCVSCGMCEDACPMAIPVAQIFSMVADETQGLFDYVSGRSLEEPLPLIAYEEEEFHELEDTHD